MRAIIAGIFLWFLLALFLTCCATTSCEEKADQWHQDNVRHINRMTPYVRPHMKDGFYPRYVNVMDDITRLSREEYLNKCYRKGKGKRLDVLSRPQPRRIRRRSDRP